MASWRMNFGFVGWSMAQTRRIMRRMMKRKTKKQAPHARARKRRVLPWLPQSLAGLAVMVWFGFLSESLMKEGLREKWRRGTFLCFCYVMRECLVCMYHCDGKCYLYVY